MHPAPSYNPVAQKAVAGYRPAFIRWYNDTNGAKIACVGTYKNIAYGSVSYDQFHAAGKPPHPEFGFFQWGVACCPSTLTIGLDGDHTDKWPETATGKYLGDWRDAATSVRELPEGGFKFHVMIIVPPELVHLWPKQRPAAFGHIKSNGFTYVEGVHASGTEYKAIWRKWLVADEGLMRAFLEDNGNILHTDHDAERDDDLLEMMKDWRDPDGIYPASFAEDVLETVTSNDGTVYDWSPGGRNDSLMLRCGFIKAAGENGISGMGTLFDELCVRYAAETGRDDDDVYRAFRRSYPRYAEVQNRMGDWSSMGFSLPRIVAIPVVPWGWI